VQNSVTPFIDGLVDQEVRRLVSVARRKGAIISTGECVTAVRRVYPTSGLSRRKITDKVIAAGSAAGVAIEIGPGKRDL